MVKIIFIIVGIQRLVRDKMENKRKVLSVSDLVKSFKTKKTSKSKEILAVDNLSFYLEKRENLGIAGESGCGKTTLGKCIIGLYRPDSGKIIIEGKNILELSSREFLKLRKNIQMIFQDPYSSLNPRWNVFETISEPLRNYKIGLKKDRIDRVKELLGLVGLPLNFYRLYPHQMSGGQRQRVAIARALALNPDILICDEVVSALDVSIQAQILNLFLELQEKVHLSMLFISHNLAVVKHISDRVAIMYLGEIIEIGPSDDIFKNPLHPYTKGLIYAIPEADPITEKAKKQSVKLNGEVTSHKEIVGGCKFNKRCKYSKNICFKEKPDIKKVENNHFVSCYLYKK